MLRSLPATGEVPEGTVALLGLPMDHGSSFLRGPALGPARIREALLSPSANLATESGRDLGLETLWCDAGDLDPASPSESLRRIATRVGELLARGARVLSLGGDHSVTHPVLRAHAAHLAGRPGPGLTVVQFDAHPDLYHELEGNPHSHACPFARVLEEGLIDRLVQVGIRTINPHQRAQAERFGVEVLEMRHRSSWTETLADLQLPIYVSLDLDVLDPAFAPGVSHHEPGGLSVRELLELVQALPALEGADLVELNPLRDPYGPTAMVGAKLVKELTDRLLPPPPGGGPDGRGETHRA